MKVAIFEPDYHGHRYSYVRRLVAAVSALGQRPVVVTTTEGLASTEFAEQLRAHEAEFTIGLLDDLGVVSSASRRRFGLASLLRQVPDSFGAGHVLVPYADGVLQMCGLQRAMGKFNLPREVELEGLLMRGALAYNRAGVGEWARARAWVTLTGAAPFAVLHHLDPLAREAIRARDQTLGSRISLMPDPAEAVGLIGIEEARSKLGIPSDGRLAGCVGAIDRRKGIDLLIQAFAEGVKGKNDRLLLAGPHGDEVRALLRGPVADLVRSGRLLSLDRYLTEEDLRLAIAAMDLVVVPYPPNRGHSGSSSVVIHAISQGRPVLGSQSGWIGETIRRFELGTTCNVLDPQEFGAQLAATLSASRDHQMGEAARRFTLFHTPGNFAAVFTRRLRQRLGLAPSLDAIEWDWVLGDTR